MLDGVGHGDGVLDVVDAGPADLALVGDASQLVGLILR